MTSRPEDEVLQTGISGVGARFRLVPRRLLAFLLRSDRFQRDMIRLGGGTALGQLCVVAVAPILTRLYTPFDFALVGLVASFVGFAAVAVGLRYDLAIVDARTDWEAHILLLGAILSAIPVSLIASFIYLWMIYHRVLTFEKLPPWTAGLVFITLLLSGLFISCRLWCARVADFHIVSRALVFQGIGRAAFPLLLAPLHWGWAGLLSGEVVGRVLGVFGMVIRAIDACRVQLAAVTAAEIRETLVAHRLYPLVMLPSSLLDALQGFLPLPIIITLFGPLNAGQFVLVARVSAMPMTLIAASVSDVYHSRIADTARNSPQNTELVFRKMALHLARIALAIYFPIALVSPFLFGVIFGPNWQKAGILCAILGPAMAIQLVSSPLTRTLNVLGYQSWKLGFDIPRLCGPLGGLWWGHHLGLSFTYSIALFTAGTLCVETAMITIIWQATRMARP
jgi:lipopolysaccharide exporter